MITNEQTKMVGKYLRKLRLNKDIRQAELAKHLGITEQAYSAYERGLRIPRDETKLKIAELYGLTVDDIFFRPMITK